MRNETVVMDNIIDIIINFFLEITNGLFVVDASKASDKNKKRLQWVGYLVALIALPFIIYVLFFR